MGQWTLSEIATKVRAGSLTPVERRRLQRDKRAGARVWLAKLRAEELAAEVEAARLAGMLEHETLLWGRGVQAVAGVDEVGVGPLAGPVVAAAVILPAGTSLAGIDDSKKLTAAQRDSLAQTIKETAVAWALGECSVAEIDTLNIYQAALEAMRRAVAGLGVPPQHLLVDARRVPRTPIAQTSLIHGDSRSQSIAAASIIAKVSRDQHMEELARLHPGYGFESHRGYATAAHLNALARLGASPVHRVSFSPVAGALRRPPDPGESAAQWS